MKLAEVRVTDYKSIDDSSWVNMADVTCLVGKNESGKTAILQALYKLSPVEPANGNFDEVMEYPRRRYAEYSERQDKTAADVVSAKFELTDVEIEGIEDSLGKGVLKTNLVMVTKDYANVRRWDYETDEEAVVTKILSKEPLTEELKQQVASAKTLSGLESVLKSFEGKDASATALLQKVRSQFGGSLDKVIDGYLDRFIPRFMYFDDYSTMEGNISINQLEADKNANKLSDKEITFLALLGMAGAKLEDFKDQSQYERLKAKLEAASNRISDEAFTYWSQNTQLEVEFDISQGKDGTIIHLRVRNNRHRVSVDFGQRSRGFVWFFSFFAYFSQYEKRGDNIILLLDEPGLSLHASAQGDFLKLIDERLAPKYQVVYTTHSPFMVSMTRLDRVRTVEDVDGQGTVVSAEVLRKDKDTVFPLQAAMGYSLAQSLFVGPNNLLVEGPSDFIYLQVLDQAVRKKGKTGLDPRWTVVPVGGADKLSTFISLLGGNQLNIVALIDSEKNIQRLRNLQENALLKADNLVPVGEIIGVKEADIEDIFEPDFYLDLVNQTYDGKLPNKLSTSIISNGSPRIVKRIEEYVKKNGNGFAFNHYDPAAYLLTHQAKLLAKIDDSTIERASKLFERINAQIKI